MKRMAILFLIIGIISLGLSAYFFKKNETPKSLVKTEITKPKKSDFDVTNKQKGDDFEDYMIQLLGKQRDIKFMGKVSDYHKDGVSAQENRDPDLRFKIKDFPFSVECKWRNSFINEHITWAQDYQIQNYKNYQKVRNEKVFVAIGIGGKPNSPAKLFLVPLNKLSERKVQESSISKFEIKNELEIHRFVKSQVQAF